jgi:hypothetical protein
LGAVTLASTVSVPVPPLSSVTVTRTRKLFGEAYACVGFAPVPVLPSPKSHRNEAIVPSASVEVEPSKPMV